MRKLITFLFLMAALATIAAAQVPAPTFNYYLVGPRYCNPSTCTNQAFIAPGFSAQINQDVQQSCANGGSAGIHVAFLGVMCANFTEIASYAYTAPYTWPYYAPWIPTSQNGFIWAEQLEIACVAYTVSGSGYTLTFEELLDDDCYQPNVVHVDIVEGTRVC